MSCALTCNFGYANCNNDWTDGCEVNLTGDPNNCNACGHGCLGGACSASACQPLVLGALTLAGASEVILDSTYAFFRSRSAVYRINKSTRALQFVWQEPTPVDATSLATDGTNLYAGTVEGKVYRFAKDGGNSIVFYDSGTTLEPITAIAAGGGFVYFQNGYKDVGSVRLNGTGFTSTPIYSSNSNAIVADASDGYYAGYYNNTNGIYSFSGAGVAAPFTPTPQSLAMDANYFYWTSLQSGGTPGRVGRMARDGSGAITLASFPSTSPTRVAVDSTDVYFTIAGSSGSIGRVPSAGGTSVTVASGQANPSSVAVDTMAIYWTNYDSGAVMRLAK